MESFETLTTIVTIVSVIFGILNIILFFKLWGMTDDVKRMLNIMEKSYYGEKEERYNIDESTLDQYQLQGIVNKYKAFIPPRSLPTFFIVAKEGE